MSSIVPVHRGEVIELAISGLGSSGEGVGRYAAFTVFVPGALPGERVRAVVEVVKSNYAIARVQQLLQAAAQRCAPPCPLYADCGGCQLQHLSYDGQLRFKEQRVKDALTRIGHLHTQVLPIIACDHPWGYRNKMQFPAGMDDRGGLAIGCYAAATHRVVDCTGCLIQQEANNAVLRCVRTWMQKYQISAYNERSGKGLVRHVMGRVGVSSGEVMAVLITSAAVIPRERELLELLQHSVPGLTSVVQNINRRPGNVIMGEQIKVLYGSHTIRDGLGDLQFNISAQSFFQVNSAQAEKLYAQALACAALTGKETVLDLYCGTGTISLYLAQQAKQVYGIEIVAAAIKDAISNARANNCHNIEFIAGDAAEQLQQLLDAGVAPDVVLLDPPRAGCSAKLLAAVAAAAPQRLVYVSCNPASLARDLAFLEQHGYQALTAQPVDMFPMTAHVECVALLVKQGSK